MRRSRGLKKVLLIACALAVAVAFVLPATDASAFSQPIPTKVSLLKWGGNPRVGKLYKIVSKPISPPLFPLPAPGSVSSGSVLVTVGDKTLTCDLTKVTWKGLGNPAGSKGYKYVNTAAPGNDPCKVVIVKEKVIKVLAKGVGGIDLPLASGNPDVSLQLVVGGDSYCALATGPHSLEKADTIIKMKDEPAPAACCDCTGLTSYAFTTGLPTGGSGGTLSNYRCSNNASGACAADGDCDYGTCFITPPFCAGNLSVPCAEDADCVGTCNEVTAGNLPLALSTAALYTGGGLNSVPLPLPVPDQGHSVYSVSGGVLGPTTAAAVGERNCTSGRTCSENGVTPCVLDSDCAGVCDDNCLYGPPLPIPNSGTPSTSVCAVNVVGTDASGTVACEGGDTDIDIGLRSVVYLNGDLFKASTPPDIPGVQPCPLCDTLCQGGAKADFPCDDDTDCPGGTCGLTTECLGGPNNGAPCTPETSDSTALGDPENSYPTSQDCGNDPLQDITANIGGLPIALTLTTGSQTLDADDRAAGARTFCGFCRDVTGAGSLCFEGDTDAGCPAAIPVADGNGVACTSNTDCTADADEYESCVQRNPGAFSEAAATRISVAGTTDGGCLADGNPHAQDQVAIFCIPPTFDATVDAAGDLPGPGATLLKGDAQLSPSGAFMETGGIF